MSPLFTCIVIIMGLLAVMGIVVGVANDAVNFLNSALGSKVAPVPFVRVPVLSNTTVLILVIASR